MGEFVLPAIVPPRLLFISGGSGIAPIASLIRHLLATGYSGRITALHYARREVIFGDELSALAREHRNFRFRARLTRCNGGAATDVHLSRDSLERAAPDWAECETYVCGPAALLAAVSTLFLAHGVSHRLHVERFAPAVVSHASSAGVPRCRIVFERSGRAIDGSGATSLLAQAEQAGLDPAFGCRIGICQTCKCKKLSGTVRNQLTGMLSSEPDEEIQLCVNTPHSDVRLDL